MGQRPSMQQSEVVRRRSGPELGSTQATGSAVAAHIHRHRRANGALIRQPQEDTSSASSTSSSPLSVHSSSRSSTEEGGAATGGAAELARFFSELGFVPLSRGTRQRTSEVLIDGTTSTSTTAHALVQTQNSGGDGVSVAAASSVPSTSVRQALTSSNPHNRRSAGAGDHHHHRHQRHNGAGGAGATSSSSSRQRVSRNHHHRGDGTDRLQTLLHSLGVMANGGTLSSSSSSAPSTQLSAVQLNKLRRSAPLFHLLGHEIKCPVCRKIVPSDDVEMHLVMCLTRSQLSYNDDVLTMDKGECAICLEEMAQGAHIARLPCLCIYHKSCIDEWFKRKNTCPEHPGND